MAQRTALIKTKQSSWDPWVLTRGTTDENHKVGQWKHGFYCLGIGIYVDNRLRDGRAWWLVLKKKEGTPEGLLKGLGLGIRICHRWIRLHFWTRMMKSSRLYDARLRFRASFRVYRYSALLELCRVFSNVKLAARVTWKPQRLLQNGDTSILQGERNLMYQHIAGLEGGMSRDSLHTRYSYTLKE